MGQAVDAIDCLAHVLFVLLLPHLIAALACDALTGSGSDRRAEHRARRLKSRAADCRQHVRARGNCNWPGGQS